MTAKCERKLNKGIKKEKVIRPVSSQLAEFLRLAPTPASSDEIGGSAVNQRVADLGSPKQSAEVSMTA
jgi:hypothetical protein